MRRLKLAKTFLHIWRDILLVCVSTDNFSSSSVCGEFPYTLSFKYPQRKKSNGFKSGEWGAHSCSARLLMILFPNTSLKKVKAKLEVWGVAPSCWNQACLMLTPCLLFNSLMNRRTTSTYNLFTFGFDALFRRFWKSHPFFNFALIFLFLKLWIWNLENLFPLGYILVFLSGFEFEEKMPKLEEF